MSNAQIGIKIGLQGAEQVQQGLAKVSGSLDKVGGAADDLAGALGGRLAGAFAGLLSGAALSTFVRSTVEAIDRLNDVADATGSSVEEISKLERVAKLTGTSMDTVTTTLIKFNAALKEAKPGSGADAALKAIGVEAAKLRELDPSEALRQTAVALAGFADDGNKARVVQELFGKSLREAAPFLKDLAEAGEINATVTTQQALEAEKFNKQLFMLSANASEAARSIISDLLPALNDTLEKFLAFQRGPGLLSGFGDLLVSQFKDARVQAAREEVERLTQLLNNPNVTGFNRSNLAYQLRQAREELVELQGEASRARTALNQALGVRDAGGGRGFVNPDIVRPRVADIATPSGAATAAIDKNAEAVKRLTSSLEAKVAAQQAELDLGRSLTAAEQLELKLRQDLADGTIKLTESEEKRVLALIGAVAANDELLRKEKQLAESRRENLDNATRAQNAANSLEDQVRAAREAVEAIGLQGVALAELEAARIRDTAAEKERRAAVLEGIDPEVAASYRAQAAALRELAGLKVEGAVKQATVDGTRAALDDARRTFDQVSQSLADALLNGGKSAGEALKRYFKTLILQPIIKAIVNPIVGAAAGALGFSSVANAANVAGGGSSALNLLSSGASFASIASQAAAGFSAGVGSTITSLGTTFGSTAVAEFGLGLQGLALPSSTGALAAGGQVASGFSSFASSAVTAAPYIAAALVALNALGVFRSKRQTDAGLVGTLGAGSINDATVIRRGGTLFNGPEYTTNIGSVSAASEALQKSFDGLRQVAAAQATALGLSAEAARSFTTAIGNDILNNDAGTRGLSLNGLSPEQAQAKIAEALNRANEELAQFVLGTTEFTRNGESAVQALGRLSSSLVGVNQVLDALGLEQLVGRLSNAAAASTLADAFGGLEGFAQTAGQYFEAFYSEAERGEIATRQLTAALASLGVDTVPATREAFRDLVDAQDLTTESGRATFTGLLKLSGAFAALNPQIEDAAGDLNARASLEGRLLSLLGDSVEIRRREIAAIDIANRALARAVGALEDAGRAADAAATNLSTAESNYSQAVSTLRAAFAREAQQAADLASKRSAAADAVRSAAQAEIDALQDIIRGRDEAASRLRAAYDREAGSIGRTVDRLREFGRSVRDLRESLSDRIAVQGSGSAAAFALFRDVAARARAGDEAAFGKLAASAQTALDQSLSTSGDFLSYLRDFAEVQSTLAGVEGAAESQADVAEAQLKAIKDQVRSLISIDEGVQSIADAIAEFVKANDAATVAEARIKSIEATVKATLGEGTGAVSLSEAVEAYKIADRAATAAQVQLKIVEQRINELVGIDKSLISIADAIEGVRDAVTALDAARIAKTTADNAENKARNDARNVINVRDRVDDQVADARAAGTAFGGLAVLDDDRARQINEIYRRVLGRDADSGGLEYFDAGGMTISEIEQSIRDSNEAFIRSTLGVDAQNEFIRQTAERLGIEPVLARARGGYTPPGMVLVGEEGPELVNFRSPGMVYNAGQTESILGGGRAMAEELRALRQELAMLRAEARATAISTAKSADLMERATDGGQDYLRVYVDPTVTA